MLRMLVGLLFCAISATAAGDVVATCGASKGHGYFIPKGLVPPSESGWSEEAISKGSFQLIRSGEDWDIIFTDSTGGTLSSRGDGGNISAIVTGDGDVTVQIVYERSVEIYVFWLSLKDPIVTFSQAKFAALVPKHSLMVAKCKKGAR